MKKETTVAKPAAETAEEKKKRMIKAVRSLLIRLAALAIIVYVLLFHIVGITKMPNGDMYPRISAGDMLLYYRLERSFKAQDVVVFDKTEGDETWQLVCRVLACPGDVVDITDEKGFTVNGNAQVETNVFYPTRAYAGHEEYPITLGDDEYFVMADYRNGGADSRYFGPVKKSEIKGVVITVMRRNGI